MSEILAFPSKDVEDCSTCDVCYEFFAANGDRTPRLLTSCGHTFCLRCLNELFQRKGRLECPSCRIETRLRRCGDGPASLPINFRIVQLLEITKSRKPSHEDILRNACVCANLGGLQNSPLLCMNCEEDALQVAVWGCVNCSTLFCEDCNALHLKLKTFRSHRTLSCEEYRSHCALQCFKHPTELIEFMCSDCGVIACQIGLSLNHSGHKILSVEAGAVQERIRADKLEEEIYKQVQVIESQLTRVVQKSAECRENLSDLHDKIEREGGKLITMLNERIVTAHAKVDELGRKSSLQLEVEKDTLEDHLARARSCLQAAQRVPTETSAVAVCSLSQEAHVAMGSFLQEFTPVPDRRAGITGVIGYRDAKSDHACGGEARSGRRIPSRAAVETQLLIDDNPTSRVMGLIHMLFPVKEMFKLSQPSKFPLRRRDRGVIGSVENLNEPKGLAVRSTAPESGAPSLLFVADYAQDHVQVFDADTGAVLRSIGNGVGNAAGELIGPRNVLLRQLSPSGAWLLYVSDTENNRIQVFNADTGAHLRVLCEGHLKVPEGMALHEPVPGGSGESGEPKLLFVVCSGDDAVKVIDADSGEILRSIGSSEAGPAQLRSPEGLALRMAPPGSDIQSLLYVSDLENDRIQVFDADTGAHVFTIGEGVREHARQLKSPSGMALQEPSPGSDEPCLLFVADYFNDRVQVYNADTGAHVRSVGEGRGKDVGQLVSPEYVSLHPGADGTMLMFVSETNRVQVFVL